MRARLLALAAGLLVVVGFPLVRLLGRWRDPAPGDLDLSDAWSWTPVVAAGLATSAAVFFWCLHRDAVRRERAVHETFEYHDAMLQSVVVAKMALELDEPARAGVVLDGVIASGSDVVTSFHRPRRGVAPGSGHSRSGVDRRTRPAVSLVLSGEGRRITGRGDALLSNRIKGEDQ